MYPHLDREPGTYDEYPLLDLQLELVPADLVPVSGQPPHLMLQPLHLRVPGGEGIHQVNL